jgi:phosphatidylserine/phosphatidylglycerophosphate/cardiolipin synthase-like enzyme
VSKTNASLTLLVLIGLLILGIFYAATGRDPIDIFGTESGTCLVANVPAANNASGTWWEVYFTDPVNMNDPANWQSSVAGRLIEKINAAQSSIHIASFEFDLTPVAQALIAAKQRGVDVRWVTDDEHGLEADGEPDHGQFEMLQSAGIEVRSDERSALMHNKFWIFDGQTVYRPTNITESGVFKQIMHCDPIARAGCDL